MRCMACDAAFGFHGRVFVNKWALLVRMTLDAGCVGAGGESRLFEFETAVRIMAIAALHGAFQDLVMEGQIELVLGLAVTTHAKLWFAGQKQFQIGEPGFLGIGAGDEHVRSCHLSTARLRMARVAVSTSDIVAPVLAATEVVVFLSARVTT